MCVVTDQNHIVQSVTQIPPKHFPPVREGWHIYWPVLTDVPTVGQRYMGDERVEVDEEMFPRHL